MTTTVECSDTYSSDDAFELSLSPLSSLEGAIASADVVNDRRPSNQEEEQELEDSEEEEDESYEEFEQLTSEERSHTTAASNASSDGDEAGASGESGGDDDDRAGASGENGASGESGGDDDDGAEGSNENGDDDGEDGACKESCSSTGPPTAVEIGEQHEEEAEEETIPVQPESCVVDKPVGLSCRTPKQEYLYLKHKVQTAWEGAKALAERRYEEDSRVKLQAQQAKESWHTRIHRRPTETELHRKVAGKTAQSIIDAALNREAWAKGTACARARVSAREQAFSSALDSLLTRASEKEKLSAAAERDKAAKKAEASSTVWKAARFGVPVKRLQELMEQKIDESSHTNPSEPFEQLCRRVQGVVVESKHPYTKGVRQEFEACVPGADHFYVAFDSASNATMGTGRVALREPGAEDPAVFSPRGAYHGSDPDAGRLPGVNGEPPQRIDGSSVLVTFSASYWRGVAPAGDDYGWRLVCFTADDDGDADGTSSDERAISLIVDAERAADRAQAVDAVNLLGETCLHVACFEGNLEAVRYLLSLDADPNSAHTAGGGNTPLHEAARGGSLGATLLLLKSSANVIAANSHGDLPLHVACRRGRVDIARRLLAHDRDWATVAARNHAGLRPSDVAHGCAALASLLEQVQTSALIAAGDAADAATVTLAGAGRPRTGNSSEGRASSSRRSNRRRRGGGDGNDNGNNGLLGKKEWPRRSRQQQQQLQSPPRGGGSGGRGTNHSRPLLSGSSTLPRLARLPRPLDGCGGGNSSRNGRRVELEVEGETPSIAGCSGASSTSYGASLAESDFAVPAGSPDVAGVSSARGRRGVH